MEFENLLKLIQAVSDSELTGLKYEEKGVKLHLTKEKETVMTAVQTVPAGETQQAAAFAQATSFARQHRHLLPLRQQGQKNRKWKGTS